MLSRSVALHSERGSLMPVVAQPRQSSNIKAKVSVAQKSGPVGPGNRPEAEILFQKYFKSVGPRTYAAQLKKAGNGNHFLVFTEGKRDDNTGEVRKTRLFVFSEDFAQFFRMLHETAQFIRDNPVPAEVKAKRAKYWAKQNGPTRPERSKFAAK
jgi:hypothetical protein